VEPHVRLDLLERHNRLLKVGLVLIFLISVAATFLTLFPSTPVVESRGFVLKAKDGSARAELVLGAEGEPCFRLMDSRGEPRLEAGLGDDKPYFRLKDARGKCRLDAMITAEKPAAEETTQIVFRDASEDARIMVAVSQSGDPLISLFGASAQIRVVLGADSERSWLSMADSDDRERLVLGVDGSEAAKEFGGEALSFLSLRDPAGNVVASLLADGLGSSHLHFSNGNADFLYAGASDTGRGAIMLGDPAGDRGIVMGFTDSDDPAPLLGLAFGEENGYIAIGFEPIGTPAIRLIGKGGQLLEELP